MILNPSEPDPSGLLAALGSLPHVQSVALARALAGYRDELAGDLPRVAAVWSEVLCLLLAVRDAGEATVNRVLLDTFVVPGSTTCEPDADPGEAPIEDQLAVLDAVANRAMRLRENGPAQS